MTVFFQHVGEAGGKAHFPLTIGTPGAGLRRFRFEDIEGDLRELNGDEVDGFCKQLQSSDDDVFQIWGIPSGASFVIKNLVPGDYLLLLETVGPGGTFVYGGRVLARAPRECFFLSQKLWGEARYPVIVLLKGAFTSYSWFDFCDALHYKRTYNPRGQTQRVPLEKLTTSAYGDEITLISRVLGSDLDSDKRRPAAEPPFLDPAQLDVESEEGRRILVQHLRLERSSALVRDFKLRLNEFRCAVCGFDFEKVYGDLGRGFIECHHAKPVSQMKSGERTSLKDLIAICSNCHRMLHRASPILSVDDLKVQLAAQFATVP